MICKCGNEFSRLTEDYDGRENKIGEYRWCAGCGRVLYKALDIKGKDFLLEPTVALAYSTHESKSKDEWKPIEQPFFDSLTELINKESKENTSNTPDFIIAEFLRDCLDALNMTIMKRDEWYKVHLEPGNKYFEEVAKEKIING